MRVLIVGGGGREHALAWACARDRDDVDLIVAPGNAGTAQLATNMPVDVTDAPAVARLARDAEVDLVVLGPDAAAASGVADACSAQGIAVFGPTRAAARIESSKTFAKRLMDHAGIPTAAWMSGSGQERAQLSAFVAELGGRCVVKADGLALGKGVVVCDGREEAEAAIDACLEQGRFGDAGRTVVVEERLEGPELSVLALSDGERVVVLPPSRDYKRAYDGDAGPNTGGMGAVAPPADVDSHAVAVDVTSRVLQPCVDALRELGTPFRGCLYAGLMLTPAGMRVLEFNARFGDPEAQVVLPLLDEPLLDLLQLGASGELRHRGVIDARRASAGVVLAASGYPGAVRTGDVIDGVESLDSDVRCFHAGTRRDDRGRLVTAGGRVLAVVAVADTIERARERVYANVERVRFDGRQLRRDIGIAHEVALQR